MKRLPLKSILKSPLRSSQLVLFVLLFSNTLTAQNLITNGDFESGNGAGFTSNYNYLGNPSGTSNQKEYSIVADPFVMNNASYLHCTDHTTGTGKMMVVDGSFSSGDKIWEQSPGGGIQINSGSEYTFSYWIQSISSTNQTGNLPDIEVRVNGTVITPTTGSTVAPSATCTWTQVIYKWTATTGYAQIWLYDKTTSAIGNDFALDDLSLVETPGPLAIFYTHTDPVCIGSGDGTIFVKAIGGVPPYTYSLNGGPFVSNNGLFTGVQVSTGNVVTVQDAATPNPASLSSTTPIDIVAPSNPVVISKDTTICKGASANLLASGGISYSWSPAAGLTVTDIPNPPAKPDTSTTYTVTAEVTSNNLIANPSFEDGNVGFTSDYKYYTYTTNQKSYGITANAKDFDVNFSECRDHTNGNGMLMAIDGSTAANDRVWCQKLNINTATDYTFSYWIETIALPSPGEIETWVNGSPITGTAASSTFRPPLTLCEWTKVSYLWNSGNSDTAHVCLYDRNLVATGNDFALDDISFTASCVVQKSVRVTVSNTSAIPEVVTPVNYCQGAEALALTATGTNLLWYTTSTGGTGSATAPVPSTSSTGSTTYYVTQTGDCGESERASITVNVTTSTAAPGVTTPLNYCQNAQASPLTATGANLLWYSTETGGTGSATAPVPSTINTGSTLYYVSQSGDCGESERKAITVNVTTSTATPEATTPVNYCQDAHALPLVATGTSLLWYASSTGGTGTPTAPIPSTAVAGSTIYYVTQTGDCGVSERKSITVNITKSADAPFVSSPVDYCQNEQASALTATGTNLLWYTSATGGTGNSNAPVPSTSTPGSATYYVSQGGECGESQRASIVVDVATNPVIFAGVDQTIASGSSASITAVSDQEGIYLWSPSELVSNSSSLVTVATPLVTTPFTLTVTNSKGCRTSDQIIISVDNEGCAPISVPPVFTPNNDGANDRWNIARRECVTRMGVQVFNRWGGLVFSAEDYNNDWDGKYKNKPLPDATYYYIMRLSYGNSTFRILKGNVTIIR